MNSYKNYKLHSIFLIKPKVKCFPSALTLIDSDDWKKWEGTWKFYL